MQSSHPHDLFARLADAWQLSCVGQIEAARHRAEEIRHEAVAGDETRALALANEYLGWFCVLLSRLEDGLRYAQLGAALWCDLGDAAHEATARSTLAWLMSEVGDEDAINEAQRAAALAEQSGDYPARSFAANALCVVLWMLQQHDLAEQAGMQAVTAARVAGDVVATGRWLSNAALPVISLGDAAAALGDQDAAEAYRQRAIALTHEAATTCLNGGDTWGAFIAFCNLAELQIVSGVLTEAETSLAQAQALSMTTVMGNQRSVIAQMTGLLLAARSDRDGAVLSFLEAMELATETGTLCLSVQIAKQLSDVLAECGRFEEALYAYQQYFELYIRRSAERSQVRARTLSRQQEFDALQQHAAHFERLAGEDPLTGLRNRRGLDAQLEALRHAQSSYGIAVADVDQFKAINDTHSHIVGDEVLRRLGLILRAASQRNISAGRLGGEEFLIILEGISEEEGVMLCERLRASVDAFDWQILDPRLTVTISIGFALGQPGSDPLTVLAQADRNLYFAKQRGRNRLVSGGNVVGDLGSIGRNDLTKEECGAPTLH